MHRPNGAVMKSGFSLIELMIVILLIGIIASVGIPRFTRGGRRDSQVFIGRLNSLVQDGILAALQTNESQKVFFDIQNKKVELQGITDKKVKRSIDIPKSIEISDFNINGKSPFIAGGGEKRTVYFLINPEGISQEVNMIIIDHAIQAQQPSAGRYEFYLNPFSGLFRLA